MLFDLQLPDADTLFRITAADSPWCRFGHGPLYADQAFYSEFCADLFSGDNSSTDVVKAYCKLAASKKAAFPHLCEALEGMQSHTWSGLPKDSHELDKWLHTQRLKLQNEIARSALQHEVVAAARKAHHSFDSIKLTLSRFGIQAAWDCTSVCEILNNCARQPDRMHSAVGHDTTAFVDVHRKVVGFHNAVILQQVHRACVQNHCHLIEQQKRDCGWTRTLNELNEAVADIFHKFGVDVCEREVEIAEKNRGKGNQLLGAAVEDSLFEFGSLELKRFIGLFLLSAPRNSENGLLTTFGAPPDTPVGIRPKQLFVQPTVDEVERWSSWLQTCMMQDSVDKTFRNKCRKHHWPCLHLVRGCRYYSGDVQLGEFDLLLVDRISEQVLAVGEIKAGATDLIGARKQRNRLCTTVSQALSQSTVNEPDGKGFRFLTPPGVDMVITAAWLRYFLEYPVFRWVMISFSDRSSSRAPGRINWKLLRELGLELGWASIDGGADPSKSVASMVKSEEALRRITQGMLNLWIPLLKKDGFESPSSLITESKNIGFCNILLVRRR